MTMGMGDFEPPDDYYGSDEEEEGVYERDERDDADDVLAALKDEGIAPWQR
jgi:hypothetical protein